jgi:hypothetical protein
MSRARPIAIGNSQLNNVLFLIRTSFHLVVVLPACRFPQNNTEEYVLAGVLPALFPLHYGLGTTLWPMHSRFRN